MNLEALRGRRFDLLVVGGGIHGAGIARDAALRGLSVALVEARDFASGTTSRSTRLVHGGLRYLEYLRLGMVREALRERARLLSLAPGMVEPLEFLLPVYAGDPRPLWKVLAGLALYDLLGARRGGGHRGLAPRHVLGAAPVVGTNLVGGALYRDARCLPERLALANVLDAEAAGTVVANYCEVVRLRLEAGRVRGAFVRDVLDGEGVEVEARVVANAAGPWAEAVVERAGIDRPRLLRPVRGAHVVLAGLRLDRAVASTAADGRLVFAVPWGDLVSVGTTEVEHAGDAREATASPGEVQYLLGEARRLFPRAEFSIVQTYAGVRNLVAEAGPARAVSREARIVRHAGASGLVTLVGGKISTYRSLAERLVDPIAASLGARGPCRTAERPLPAPPFDPRGLATPTEARAAARASAADERVRRLSDFVFRRSWLGFASGTTRAHLEAAAEGCGEALGWDAARRRAEVEETVAEAERLYARRFSPPATP